MKYIKNWKYCLFGFVLFTACKSADCGCPMAAKEPVKENVLKKEKIFYTKKIAD